VQVTDHLKNYSGFRPRVIVHVGAHLAEELAAYEALSPEIIVWIEADPEIYRRLVDAVGCRGSPAVRHICVNALIADTAGRDHKFYHFSNDGQSSSVFRSAENLRLTWPDVFETGRQLTLKSETLCDALTRIGIAPEQLDILVLDIQGAELMALEGTGEYLRHVKFLEVEVSTIPIYQGAPLFRDLDPWITGHGFRRLSEVSFPRRCRLYAAVSGRADGPARVLCQRSLSAAQQSPARAFGRSVCRSPAAGSSNWAPGIGDHTGYFVDRGCEVTRVEGRGENLAVLRARFPSLATILFDPEDDPIPDLGGFNIVYA
jgi:FkbM family methyltransferase